MFARLSCSVVAMIASITVARADSCDPTTFKSDNLSIHEQWVKYIYAQSVTQTQQSSGPSGLNIGIPGLGDLDGSAANSYVSQLLNSLNLNLQKDEKQFLFASDFTPLGVQAYIHCLENSKINVYLRPSANSEGEQDFTVFVGLRPYPTDELIQIVVDVVTGGKIKNAPAGGWQLNRSGTQLIGRLAPSSVIPISINRDVTKRFELRATAGGKVKEPESMSLPAVPSEYLIQEARYSKVFRGDCNDCNYPKPGAGLLSISLPTDETIVPKSEYIVYCNDGGSIPGLTSSTPDVNVSSSHRVFSNLTPPEYSKWYHPHNADISVNVAVSEHSFSWHANWMLKLDVLVPVPVGQNSSDRRDFPGRLVIQPHLDFCSQ